MASEESKLSFMAPPPSWLKTFIDLGFTTSVAIALLAAMLGWIPSPMMAALARIEYHSWRQTIIMSAICKTLESSEKRVNCDPWKEQS